MAINNETLTDVLADTNAISTTEADFRTGLEDTIRQVDTNQIHMNASRSITLSGDVSGTVSWEANDATDYALTITTANVSENIVNGDIANATITEDKIMDLTLSNNKIANNTLSTVKINTSSTKTLRVLDTNGTELYSAIVLQ